MTRADHARMRKRIASGSRAPQQPFNWRPFGCVRRRVSGPDLRQCLDASGSVFFVGESTLQQLAEPWECHAHALRFHWPTHIPRLVEYSVKHHNVVAMNIHDNAAILRHGLRDLVERAGSSPLRPRAYVFLQGANDAARDSLAATVSNVERFVAELLAFLRNGSLPAPRHLVLLTPPLRHYKSNCAGPGQTVCDNATAEGCAMTCGGELFRDGDGGIAWRVRRGLTPFRAFGTLSRRAALSRHAVGVWKATFPANNRVEIPGFKTEGGGQPNPVLLPPGEVVDFEALTGPLPADYSYDGEHWSAVHDVWRWLRGAQYAGKNMATAEAANVLADLVCDF